MGAVLSSRSQKVRYDNALSRLEAFDSHTCSFSSLWIHRVPEIGRWGASVLGYSIYRLTDYLGKDLAFVAIL